MDGFSLVHSYLRQTHDITKMGNYLMETGTFSNNFSYYKKAIDYKGKYLTIWQIKTEGGLQLISEITGSIKYIERSELPLSILQMPDTTILTKPAVNATSLAIKSLDDQIAALVVLRSG